MPRDHAKCDVRVSRQHPGLGGVGVYDVQLRRVAHVASGKYSWEEFE